MARLHELFWTFFKIGAFTIGGGYAMIPLMEQEIVDKRKWLDRDEFMDTMSLAQSMPGVFAVNMATNIGFRTRGYIGAITAILGNVLMPIVMIIAIAMFFKQFSDNLIVESIFKGIRPAVVALIAAPVFKMAKTAKISWSNFWIPVVATLLIWLLGVSPVIIILVAGVGGFIYGKIKGKKETKK
ncbi:MAG: chromate transporter [Bacteroidales bacterium]|jgi:chromate transporter|nr:chromate transporter [Bacteroidales bacterium]MBQ2351890.1 chromate transporter [Bacteroidales bacterium]MBQ2542575.1 chromate transporter [Bacteroidales bacterium]MBQ3990082.1 chromate transporter [Bacteroidales bacterium]MBQ5458721.1 chromate transporter [Bacteroidales bacterium]